jgi:hypothetical protein
VHGSPENRGARFTRVEIGETAFFDVERVVVHVVTGTNGENQILAEGKTAAEAWCRALGQAAEVGMLAGRPRPEIE